MCFDNDALEGKQHLKERIYSDLDTIKKSVDLPSFNLIKDFWFFFSHVASKPNPTTQDYAISTCFRMIFQRTHYPKFDGIIYPSSATNKRGLNLVLTPESVDSCLILKQAVMYKCDRDLVNYNITGDVYGKIVDVIDKRFYF